MPGVIRQNSTCKGFVRIFITCLVGIWICQGICAGIGLAAPQTIKLSKKEKKRLVEQGVAAYEKGHRGEAKTLLEKAKSVFTENYAVPYYLGAIYLEEGETDAAISEWQRYTTLDANSENALKIQKFLTLLQCEQARKRARLPVAKFSPSKDRAAPAYTIAVLPFKNKGYEVLGPLGKGFANLLISDLSNVTDLKVVDRIQTEMILDKVGLKISGQTDAASVAKIRTLLNANHIAAGYLENIPPENLRIISTVYNASKNNSTDSLKMEGELVEFYRFKKKYGL